MGLILYGSYINGLSEKILVSIQMGHFDLARHILSHNSGSVVRIVLQFCTMKGAKRDIEITLMVFMNFFLNVFRAI